MAPVTSYGCQCCIPSCKHIQMRNRDVSYHSFPKDASLREQWIQAVIQNTALPELWQPKPSHKICGAHFNVCGKKQYMDKVPRFLKPGTFIQTCPSQVTQPSPLDVSVEVTVETSSEEVSSMSLEEDALSSEPEHFLSHSDFVDETEGRTMPSGGSTFIKEEPHSTTPSALPGNQVVTENALIKCEPQDTSFSCLLGSHDSSEAAMAAYDAVPIKTEPYNTSCPVLPRSHENKDEAKTDQHPEISAMASRCSPPPKRRRASAWSDEERLEFLQEVMQRRNIIRGRFSPLLTKQDKKAAWEEIAAVLSARHPSALRTVPELKKQWDNLCSRHRAIFAEFKRQSTQTGAGVNVSQLSAVTQAVIDIISDDPPLISGVEGGIDVRSAAFNGDVIAGLPGPFTTDDPDDDEDAAFRATVPEVGLHEDDNLALTQQQQAGAGDRAPLNLLADGGTGTGEPQTYSQQGRSDTYSSALRTRAETAKLERELLALRQRVASEEMETNRLKQQTELMKQETERLKQARIRLEIDRLLQQK
ncbi:uncharacterized protein LOC135369824 isoform X2 [Ornithodoros turicata]|uniref:uncharacterized protein LOC135369824 isoform X2 n=1 Tax=Ornithodoros turicata TaxID=34597 RepID=UPI003139361A